MISRSNCRSTLAHRGDIYFVATLLTLSFAALGQESDPPLAQAPAAIDSPPVALPDILTLLLNAGMPHTGRADLSKAQQLFARAKQIAPDDARVELCYGLVLVSENKPREGLPLLDAARRCDDSLFAPAHRVFIHKKLSASSFAVAADALEEFAKAVAARADAKIGSQERREAARWMGAVFAVYRDPRSGIVGARPLRLREDTVKGILKTPDLRSEFEEGSKRIALLKEELAQSVEAKTALLGEQVQQDRDAAVEKVFQGKDKIQFERGNIELRGQQLEKWYADAKAAVSMQLKPLVNDYEKKYKEFDYWNGLRKLKGLDAAVGPYSIDRVNWECQDKAADLAAIEQKMAPWLEIARRAQLLYSRAKGQAKRRERELQDEEVRFEKMKKNLSEKMTSKDRAAKNLKTRGSALSTYIPLDLREERDAILKQLQRLE